MEQKETSDIVYMDNASLDFGGGAGVFDLNLSLPKGAIMGVIGPSGCGKTTTIRLINGIYETTAGSVQTFGVDPLKFKGPEKLRLGYIPQHFILYPNLSVEENLHFISGIYGMPLGERTQKIQPLLEFVELIDARKRLARKISGGMKRRLMLAGALLHEPDLLIADEPTAGIDPILRARIWENFRALRAEGKSLLVTTQYVGEAAYCDKVVIMRKGRIVTIDTPQGLQRQAMGGDGIHMLLDAQEVTTCMRFLDDLPQVIRVEHVPGEPDGLYVFVDDAAKELPTLLALLKEKQDITPQVAEPYFPSFDEVFVRIIQAAEQSQPMEVAG